MSQEREPGRHRGRPLPKRRPRTGRPAVEALEVRWLPSLTFQFADPVGVVGTGASVDVESNSVVNDAAGNVYVTGSLQGTADFDPGPGVTNLSSTGGRDVFVAKYSKAGALVWARDLPGAGAGSVAQGGAVAVDATGDVFLTGSYTGTVNFDPNAADPAATFTSPQNGNDVFLAKFDPNGALLWARDAAGTAGAIDEGYALAVDGSGDVAAAGSFQNSVAFGATTLTARGGFDGFVTKLSASGQFLWASATAGSGSSVAQAEGLTFDGSGDTVATGIFAGAVNFNPSGAAANLTSAGSTDIFVQKLDPSGNVLWAESVGSPDVDEGAGVAADASGNLYVTGTFAMTANFNPAAGPAVNLTAGGFEDAFLMKLSPSGQLAWAKDLSVSQYSAARGTGVGLDGSGHVFVAGYFQNSITLDPAAAGATLAGAGGFDVFVAQYDTSGQFLASRSAGGAGFDANFGVGVNGAGQVAIAGRYSGPAAFGSTTLPAFQKSIFVAQLASATAATAPPAPGAPGLEAASDTGSSQGDRVTNATTLVFDENTVSAPGNLVQLLRDGAAVGSRTGAGPITDPGPVPDGVHIYTARQTGGSGLVSPASAGVSVTVITRTPATPATPTLNPADDSGVVGDAVTNVRQPRIVGAADPNATVQFLDSFGNVLAAAATAADGSYSLTVPFSLPDGSYPFRVREIDLAGNLSAASAGMTLVIDATPPAAPTAPALLAADDSGAVGDGVTNVRQPRLTGSAVPGSSVQLVNAAGVVIGSAAAGPTGSYTVTPSSPLADGVYALRVVDVDVAGNASAPGAAVSVTILGTPPAAPASPGLLAADDSGVIGDGATTVTQPHLVGTAPAGATVRIVNPNGSVLGATTAGADGRYSVLVLTPFAPGTYALAAEVVDLAGNVGAPSTPFNLTVQNPVTVPAVPSPPSLLAADDSGAKGDGVTNVNAPRLTGTATVGTTVQLLNPAGVVLGAAAVGPDGVYSVAPSSPLADGTYAVRARDVDPSGNNSAPSAAFTLTILTAAPAAPTAPNLLAADDSGAKGDGVTNVNQPRLTGTALPGVTIQLVNGAGVVVARTTAAGDGSYALQPANPLPDGLATLQSRAADAAGNVSPLSPPLTLTILTATPAAPAAPALSAADDTGRAGDGRTAVRRPHVVGAAPAGSAVDLLDAAGNVLASAAVAAGGGYSLQPPANLNVGTTALGVRVRDAAGNVGPAGPAFNLTVVDASPGDFDGDGKTDVAVFRLATAQWIGVYSAGGTFNTGFGDPAQGDIPVPADYDGLGRSEKAVYRPGTAQWIISGPTGVRIVSFGDPARNDVPAPGDYDGVGHAELAVFRPGTGQWLIAGLTGLRVVQFGDPTRNDIPVPGDYDGTGHTEFAVFRPSTAQWLIAGPAGLRVVQFGEYNLVDIPIPGDYDGTGRTELALFRPGTGQWIVKGPTLRIFTFGERNLIDVPTGAPVGSIKEIGNVGGIHLAAVRVAVPQAATTGGTPARVTPKAATPAGAVRRASPQVLVDTALEHLMAEGFSTAPRTRLTRFPGAKVRN